MMRKDRIEERITGIEKDVKELRSEIRQELKSVIAGLKEFQELMIEGRVREVEHALSRQYCQVAYDNALDHARGTFRERMRQDCPPGEDRDACIDHLVDEHLRRGITELDGAGPKTVGTTLNGIVDRDTKEFASDPNPQCAYCYKIYDVERDRLLAMGEKFVKYREGLARTRASVYFRQLPDDLAVSEIVEPLSHKARFAMLKSLTSGSRSYKELGDITGFTGGHLLYHLNKLTDAGLAQKDGETGLYRITEKGTGVMEIVKKMYAC